MTSNDVVDFYKEEYLRHGKPKLYQILARVELCSCSNQSSTCECEDTWHMKEQIVAEWWETLDNPVEHVQWILSQ